MCGLFLFNFGGLMGSVVEKIMSAALRKKVAELLYLSRKDLNVEVTDLKYQERSDGNLEISFKVEGVVPTESVTTFLDELY